MDNTEKVPGPRDLIISLAQDTDGTEFFDALLSLKEESSLSDVEDFCFSILIDEPIQESLGLPHLISELNKDKELFKTIEEFTSNKFSHLIILFHPNTRKRKDTLNYLVTNSLLEPEIFRKTLLFWERQIQDSTLQELDLDLTPLTNFIKFLSSIGEHNLNTYGPLNKKIIEIAIVTNEKEIDLGLTKACDAYFEAIPEISLRNLMATDSISTIGRSLRLTPGGFREKTLLNLKNLPIPASDIDGLFKGVRFIELVDCIDNNIEGWKSSLKIKELDSEVRKVLNKVVGSGKVTERNLSRLVCADSFVVELLDQDKFEESLQKLKESNKTIKNISYLFSKKQVTNLKDLREKDQRQHLVVKEGLEETNTKLQEELSAHEKAYKVQSEADTKKIKLLTTTLENLQSEMDHIKSQFVDNRREVGELTSAQLDQKWIEGAKVTIEILRSLSRFPGIGPEGQDLIAFATRVASNHDIQELDPVDQIVEYRSKYYDYVGTDIAPDEGKNYKVLEACFFTGKFNEEKVLSRGKLTDN
ncbi:MAG: hypothetical protein VX353_00810 [Actinomycetota bacterium]